MYICIYMIWYVYIYDMYMYAAAVSLKEYIEEEQFLHISNS